MRNKAINMIVQMEMSGAIKYAASFTPFNPDVRHAWDQLHSTYTSLDFMYATCVHAKIPLRFSMYESIMNKFEICMVDLLAEMHGPTVALIWGKRKRLNDLVNSLPPFHNITLEDLKG